MEIHYLIMAETGTGQFGFTLCGKNLAVDEGIGTFNENRVTCEKCKIKLIDN